jgi:cytochrome c biogenesis protein
VTAVEEQAPAGVPPRRGNPVVALLRNSWRQLTSMRTALVLLFLLAIAAIPGSILPQLSVNRENVAAYVRENPQLSVWVDRLGGFEVYASPWFAAIYLLLFTSLIGCVVPRLADHLRALRAVPVVVPQRLERLPQHAAVASAPAEPATAVAAVAGALRGFRTSVRSAGDEWTVSAEKGYTKETGNLLFHAALLTVLIGVGFGHWYGWHGNRLLVAGPDTGFCSSLQQFDESQLGVRVDAADLPRLCLRLEDFTATFQANGQPRSFAATVRVDEDGGAPRQRTFSVNSPLRLDGANVYLLGHGYAPTLRYTDRYGQQQTKTAPFLPRDLMQTSEGVVTFPDVNVDPKTNKRDNSLQVGFEGIYLPTAPSAPPFVASAYPAERDPAIMLFPYRGNLGLDAGIPGSVYELDRGQIQLDQLKPVGQGKLLRPGEKLQLDDGTTVEFLGTRQWITMSVRHDPAQPFVLGGAVVGLAGLMLSLTGRRRRVFFRITPAEPTDGGTAGGVSLIEAGGLPRTDYPGFADEFVRLVEAARGAAGVTPRSERVE